MDAQYEDEEFDVAAAPEEDDFDIEVVETEFSQGEKDAGRPIADLSEEEDAEPTDDELAVYDARVQKRIKSAHAKANANRRAAEVAEKKATEAIRIAAILQDELRKARQNGTSYARVAVKSTRDSLQSQRAAYEAEYRTAIESGDAEAQVKASQNLTLVTQQLSGLPDDETLERDLAQHVNTPVPELPRAAPPPANPDLDAWKRENPWFETDPELQQTAIEAENVLMQRYGKPPGTKETLALVKTMLTPLLAERGYMQTPSPPPAPKPRAPSPTMPVVRSLPGGKQKIQLTRDQVDLAAELGISPLEYAREYARGANQ